MFRYRKFKVKPTLFDELRMEKRKKWFFFGVMILQAIVVISMYWSIQDMQVSGRVLLDEHGNERMILYARPELSDELVVDISELNDSEKLIVKNLTLAINPLFLYYQQKIVFTKDICKHAFLTNPTRHSREDCQLWGFNHDGNNYVAYLPNNLQSVKQTVCHELAHTYVFPAISDEPLLDKMHAVVDAIGTSELCFRGYGEEFVDKPVNIIFKE